MTSLKNTIVGFAVSFIGSIPLGYLNIIGVSFYAEKNIIPVLEYLLGVIAIEALVIYITLQLVQKLTFNSKWKQRISIFTIAFLLLLAFSLYSNQEVVNTSQTTLIPDRLLLYPVLTGLFLSLLNFAQIPFWFSWNLYLVNESYITTAKQHPLFYVLGAMVGTFTGMLSLIIALHKTVRYTQFSFQHDIPLIFVGLAVWQVWVLVKNRHAKG